MAEWFETLPDPVEAPSPRWRTDEFADEVGAWCGSAVGSVRSMENTKLRPWSTVWRVETADGRFYFKQNCLLQGFEAAVALELARFAPHHVVLVAGADPRRGYLLTPDQGPVLREVVGDDLDAWCRVASEGAALQRLAAAEVDSLVAAGMQALPPESAPRYVAARVDQFAGLPDGDPRRLDADAAEALV